MLSCVDAAHVALLIVNHALQLLGLLCQLCNLQLLCLNLHTQPPESFRNYAQTERLSQTAPSLCLTPVLGI